MRKRGILFTLAVLSIAVSVGAELQSVEVGGAVRLRGRYWNNTYNTTVGAPPVGRIVPLGLSGRALGPFGAASRYDWDDEGSDLSIVEQDTRLHVKADFTDSVTAFIEVESFDIWGDAFRSAYNTGVDFSGAAVTDNVMVIQSYVEMREVGGQPLRLRVGRQLIELGKGWLVDDIATAIFYQPYDAVRLTWTPENWTIDAFAAKLIESMAAEDDGDVNFYGVYGTYSGFKPVSLSLYWLLIRDPRDINDTTSDPFTEFYEELLGLDQYAPTYLNTAGLRAWGASHGFDYDLELAYQFGEADAVGALFKLPPSPYGRTGEHFDAWAGDFEVGYKFDAPWAPRVFVGGAYFEGEDNRKPVPLTLSPAKASISFNRLFAGTPYSGILDVQQDMSNFWQARAGISVKPLENISGGIKAAYYEVIAPFDVPWLAFNNNYALRQPRQALNPLLMREADDDIGYTASLWLRYDYSKDLYFMVGWDHLFTGDGLRDGSYLHRMGLEFSGGTDDADADYVYFDTGITF
ncbi:MAG: alginate export family protein [Candidatus Hydrogenedentes bacterium]|nr:alginate export family protein [Candidatus Hydrogenedentota bacterium]